MTVAGTFEQRVLLGRDLVIARPSLWFDCFIWAILPTSLNVLRVLDPNGPKHVALVALLALLVKNLVFAPATSLHGLKSIYSTSVFKVVPARTILVIYLLVQILFIADIRALGSYYTFSNAIANNVLLVFGPVALLTSLMIAETPERRTTIFRAFLLGYPLYMLINVGLFAAGMRSAVIEIEDDSNQVLGGLGLHIGRALLPLGYGKNGMGTLAAASLLICLFSWSRGWGWMARLAYVVLGLFSLVAIVLIDSRAALAFSFLAIGIALRARRSWRFVRLGKWIILAFPLVPILAVWMFDVINKAGGISFLIRGGDSGARLGVGTGRGAIWGAVLDRLSQPEWIDLVGYGNFGHIESRVSAAYAWVFNSLGGTINGVHNAFLQYVMDCGYLGGAIWLSMLFVLFSNLQRIGRERRVAGVELAMLAVSAFVYLQSQTEPLGTIYNPESLMLVIGLCIFSGAMSLSRAPAGGAVAR